jgi:GDPmannose 4,6-dehydratase|tara:strand:- start:1348 stop:2331 length:984 start_codon:yes stop_codon:yes gene_type:complete
MRKKILILGVTGQDGSYIADFLLKKKMIVHGLLRKSATGNTKNINHIINDSKIFNKSFFLHKGDILDAVSINNIITRVQPDEIYNFADQDNVSWSKDIPLYSYSTTTLAVIQIYEFLKTQNKRIKFFQPVSSNMFGATNENSLNENSSLSPKSVYALAKSSTYLAAKMYSNNNNLFICGAIFFNHESPRRSAEYVTTKIIKGVCDIYHGKKKYLYLGDISAQIDWGYAKDYVEMAWQIMQQKKPDFFIIGTGINTSVEKFADICFKHVGLNYKKYLKVDKKLLRSNKTKNLKANLTKSKKILKYKVKTNIHELIKIMMKNELEKYNE